MESRVIPNIPEANCYKCASPDVVKICHHCGRPMCEEHGPFAKPEDRRFRQYKNNEFTYLDLKDLGLPEEGVHCEYCNHYYVVYWRICLVLVALIGLVIVVSSFLPSTWFWFAQPFIVVLIFLLGSLFFLFLLLSSLRIDRPLIVGKDLVSKQNLRKKPLPAPVFGRFPQVWISEKLESMVNLDQRGNYSAKVQRASGIISTYLKFTENDQRSLELFLKKNGIPSNKEVDFYAGFLVLRGVKNVTGYHWAPKTGNPILVSGKTTGQQLLRSNHLWEDERRYSPSPGNLNMEKLPVQVIPTLISEEEEWALGILVQFTPNSSILAHSPPLIKELTLRAPSRLGPIENQTPVGSRSETTSDWSTVKWHELWFDQDQKDQNQYSKSFYIRYARSAQIEPDTEICGRFRLHFNGTVFGIEEVKFFSPLGYMDGEASHNQQTEIEVHFRFRLHGLRMRNIYSNTKTIEHKTSVPSNETITRLVSDLNNKDIYVQRVIENPPFMNQAHAKILNRFWVISGRKYAPGIPIDFRIVATGKEKYEDSDRADEGNTRFEINTQGTVLKPDISRQMSRQIDNLHQIIANKIECTPNLELEEEIYPEEKDRDKWIHVIGYIRNVGEVEAKAIRLSAKGKTIESDQNYKIDRLKPDEVKPFDIPITAKRSGSTPITIIAICKDEYGQLPPQKWTRHVDIQ